MQCIALLVAHVESQCDPALASMTKLQWVLDQTGDTSPYVTALAHHLAASVPLIRHNLHTSRKYFTRCVSSFVIPTCHNKESALINLYFI